MGRPGKRTEIAWNSTRRAPQTIIHILIVGWLEVLIEVAHLFNDISAYQEAGGGKELYGLNGIAPMPPPCDADPRPAIRGSQMVWTPIDMVERRLKDTRWECLGIQHQSLQAP